MILQEVDELIDRVLSKTPIVSTPTLLSTDKNDYSLAITPASLTKAAIAGGLVYLWNKATTPKQQQIQQQYYDSPRY